jgi:hypothetical protein
MNEHRFETLQQSKATISDWSKYLTRSDRTAVVRANTTTQFATWVREEVLEPSTLSTNRRKLYTFQLLELGGRSVGAGSERNLMLRVIL